MYSSSRAPLLKTDNMKILFACDSSSISNPYVRTLMNGLLQLNATVETSCNELWLNNNYDIIHFQWPEAVYKWSDHITQEQVVKLYNRVEELKSLGKKIVITCHNLRPHSNKDEGLNALFPVIYEHCDLFIHMGRYSQEILSSEYPNAQHIIIPHHIYNDIYHFDKSKEICQKDLGIDKSKVNVLCFGEFRTDEEREFIISLIKRMKAIRINFMVPGFYRKHWYAKSISETYKRICKVREYKRLGLRFASQYLSNALTEKYFTACDFVFIQRLNILNSGNLPMGFHAGKVVVGVSAGNVGSILKETGNPTFEANNVDNAICAIEEAISLTNEGLGEKNRLLAENEWSTETVAKKLIDAYQNLQ